MLQDPLGHHDLFGVGGGGVGGGVGELKPSVASLQATVMSNAAAAAVAYQSMGLGPQQPGPLGPHPSDTGALLHDYHNL